jgi:hypothetical protein
MTLLSEINDDVLRYKNKTVQLIMDWQDIRVQGAIRSTIAGLMRSSTSFVTCQQSVSMYGPLRLLLYSNVVLRHKVDRVLLADASQARRTLDRVRARRQV